MNWSYQTTSSSNTRNDCTHGNHQMVNVEIRLIIFFAEKDGEALYISKNKNWSDCDSDHQLFTSKFRHTLKTVGKPTRSFRYDLSQTLYDYTMEVTNRLKGLDLVDRMPEELWTAVHNIL